jgi:hypothetical protein
VVIDFIDFTPQVDSEALMTFTQERRDYALMVMGAINARLSQKFATLMEFHSLFTEEAGRIGRGSNQLVVGTEAHIEAWASKWSNGRILRKPSMPTTHSDPLIPLIAKDFWKLDKSKLESIIDLHNVAMSAENVVGQLLEAYIAEKIEPLGWVWCAGSAIKSVDFIKKIPGKPASWISLQVKNKSNSENSSSSSVRSGTSILKWHRLESSDGSVNWASFPEVTDTGLSEEGFHIFVDSVIRNWQELG